MQVYFSKEWLALVELSFRNFLAEAIEHLPLPTLLRFDTDRLQRSALQKQVEGLQTETADLKHQLSGLSKSNMAASDQQGTRKGHQHQQPRAHHLHDPTHSQFEGHTQPHIRPAQEGKAAGPPAGSPKANRQRQHNSSDASSVGLAADTSQCDVADGEENIQSSTSAEPAAEGSPDSSQHLHPQAAARIKPGWSASLATLASNVLADSGSGTLQQQASAAGEPLNLDTSSLQSPNSEAHLLSQAGSSEIITEGQQAESARSGSGQGNSAHGQQQTAARLPPQHSDAETNKDRHHHAQQGSEAAIVHRQTDNASEAVSSSQNDPAAQQLAGHDDSVTCCSFSPNGHNLATASTDGVVRISAPASLQVEPNAIVALHITCLSLLPSHFAWKQSFACKCCVLWCLFLLEHVVYYCEPSRSTCHTGSGKCISKHYICRCHHCSLPQEELRICTHSLPLGSSGLSSFLCLMMGWCFSCRVT